jgi:hypothetical protein
MRYAGAFIETRDEGVRSWASLVVAFRARVFTFGRVCRVFMAASYLRTRRALAMRYAGAFIETRDEGVRSWAPKRPL